MVLPDKSVEIYCSNPHWEQKHNNRKGITGQPDWSGRPTRHLRSILHMLTRKQKTITCNNNHHILRWQHILLLTFISFGSSNSWEFCSSHNCILSHLHFTPRAFKEITHHILGKGAEFRAVIIRRWGVGGTPWGLRHENGSALCAVHICVRLVELRPLN